MGILAIGIGVGFVIIIFFLLHMEYQLWEINHTVNHIQYLLKGGEPD